MRKFFVLVKKEVKELLTPQMLVPFLAVMLVFMFIGKVVGRESAKSLSLAAVAIADLDRSPASQLAAGAAQSAVKAAAVEGQDEAEALSRAKAGNFKALLVIPQGFGQSIQDFQPGRISAYSLLQNFSLTGSRSDQQLAVAIAAANEAVSNHLLGQKAPGTDPRGLKNPVEVKNVVVVKDRQAAVAPAAISGLVSSQTTFIPIVLFLVIIFASQMIANSVATEKENKTLETLLSTPVSRNAIVASKLVGAGLVALLTAVVYLIGMRNYMDGITGGAAAALSGTGGTQAAAQQLGLVLATPDYLLLGLSLFFGILAALSVAMILAVFAEDAKGAQGIIAPLMVMVLIPYFLTMFLDITALSAGLRWLVYAIPFAHPFLAAPNILLGQYQPVLFGILYMAGFFLVAVAVASRIFSSDKILTLKLNFGRKK